jgi:hypothetical protein
LPWADQGTSSEGEFEGVELTFMGLNNQNLHNFLFRGFLKPWEAYTGATINWIDLAQADYNARLQQSIATGTVDFDIIEMGAPVRGRHRRPRPTQRDARLGREQIDMDDMWTISKRPSAPGMARPTASPSMATATPSLTAPTISARAGHRAAPNVAEDLAKVNAVQNSWWQDRSADRLGRAWLS